MVIEMSKTFNYNHKHAIMSILDSNNYLDRANDTNTGIMINLKLLPEEIINQLYTLCQGIAQRKV